MAVEGEVGVGEVVDDEDLALAGELDHALHELDSSTVAVVGLCGKERRSTRGRGDARAYASARFANRSWSGAIATWNTLAPASIGAWMWIG